MFAPLETLSAAHISGVSSEGWLRATEVFTEQSHVVNRRLAVVSLVLELRVDERNIVSASPGGHEAASGGHEAAPGGHEAAPGGHEITPGSHEGVPGGHEAAPCGHEGATGGHEAAPGGHEAAPGGHEAAPGGHEAAPGGHEGAPGGHEAAPGGHEGALNGHEAAPGGDERVAVDADPVISCCGCCESGSVSPCCHVQTMCRVLMIESVSQLASSPVLTALCPARETSQHWNVSLRKLIPRNTEADTEYDLVIRARRWILFIPLSSDSRLVPPFPFRLQCSSDSISVVAAPAHQTAPSALWLTTHVLPKMVRWTQDMSSAPRSAEDGSLLLVDAEEYHTLYQTLKSRYGPYFVQIWPENTDPLKFVYEDLAIASYLLLLWRTEPTRQRFVDLGCGNGLLVHILTSEGHAGYGIDVRCRKIWQCYPETTRLQVLSLVPSVDTAFPDCDWLIGNHSDELTPWIPVMAAANGRHCRFFLLPCCPWDFHAKFQRTDTRLSQYEDYMRYVRRVAERCGFQVESDRLRIPSTRRRCLVGRSRTAVGADSLRHLVAGSRGDASAIFSPRPAAEPVRNCSQLPVEQVSAAVLQVALRLADVGQMSLRAAAALLGDERLALLRRQCGGLQTLFRNHRHVFRVQAGCVRLQDAPWLSADGVDGPRRRLLKTRPCWLHVNLPVGCPLTTGQCRYAHGADDLRVLPSDGSP